MRFTAVSALVGLLAVQLAAAVSGFWYLMRREEQHLTRSSIGKRRLRLAMCSWFPDLLKIYQPVYQPPERWYQLRRRFAANIWLVYRPSGNGCPKCKLWHLEMQQQEKPLPAWR